MPDGEDSIKKVAADFREYVTKLEKQRGSNVTTFTPPHKEELDALLSRLDSVAAKAS